MSSAASRPLRYVPAVALVVDVLAITVATAVATLLRHRVPGFSTELDDADLYLTGPALVVVWLVTLWLSGSYAPHLFGAGTDEYKRVVNASLLAAGLVGVTCYLARYQFSRGVFLFAFGIGVPLLVLGRYLHRRALHRARRAGFLRYQVLLTGEPENVDELAGVLRRESWLGYEVVGALVPGGTPGGATPGGVAVLGDLADTLRHASDDDLDVVFLTSGSGSALTVRRLVWALEGHDVQVVVAPSVTDVSSDRIRVRPVGGLPLMHLEPPRATDASRWGKRLFDIVGSALLLVLFSPVLLVAAIRVKAHDHGPVLFRQTRIGRHGQEFDCLKLRTMVVDAEDRLAALRAEQGYVDGAEGLFKLKDDPRITRPGLWLRTWSFDELPQLVNVLRGDMSLVGPRPPLPSEVAAYASDTTRRLHVRPGLTGLWQVSGRSDLTWDEAVRLDLYYVDNWSMVQDITILARTFSTVVFHRGAY
jgi:exopolysaccharide biosynthesis polyprenyl glycosylphosphotransferase